MYILLKIQFSIEESNLRDLSDRNNFSVRTTLKSNGILGDAALDCYAFTTVKKYVKCLILIRLSKQFDYIERFEVSLILCTC